MQTERLDLVDADGNVVVTLSAMKQGGGLWITRQNGPTVAIYSLDNQTAIGIYRDTNNTEHGMDVALTLDGIQYVENGTTKFIGFSELAALLGK